MTNEKIKNFGRKPESPKLKNTSGQIENKPEKNKEKRKKKQPNLNK